MKRCLTFVVISLLMVSCSYKASSLCLDGSSVVETAIPVIKKDPNGYLRNYLAREMSYSNSLYYKDRRAKYNLLVSITEDRNSKITYMWDRDPVTNRDLQVFYPSEGMREIVAKVELVDAVTGKKVIEPFFLTESVDYDFVNPTVRTAVEFPSATGIQSVLQFSLGQLDAEEGAQDASYKPVYEKLARKIVTRLSRTRFNKQT